MTRTSPHREAVRDLVALGLTDRQIGTKLGIAHTTAIRIRKDLHLPNWQPATLEQAFDQRTEDAGDGHLDWTGARSHDGVPVLSHRGVQYTGYRVAFKIRTGREPDGPVQPDCGRPRCVATGHVADQAERQKVRQQLRALNGLPASLGHCQADHDPDTHGRVGPDGHTYCAACSADRRKRRAA